MPSTAEFSDRWVNVSTLIDTDWSMPAQRNGAEPASARTFATEADRLRHALIIANVAVRDLRSQLSAAKIELHRLRATVGQA